MSATVEDGPQVTGDAPVAKFGRDFVGLGNQTRTLLWLRNKELFGKHTGFWGACVVLWLIGVSWVSAWVPSTLGLDPEPLLLAAATGGWLAWAVAPFFGAGGQEIGGKTRLAPYPVNPSATFLAGWAAGMIDIPALIVGPGLFGLAWAEAKVTGIILAMAFVLMASAIGQLAAWVASGWLANRSVWSWVVFLGGGFGIIVVLSFGGNAEAIARAAPGGWLSSTAREVTQSNWLRYIWVLAGMLALAAGAAFGGRKAQGWALDRESKQTSDEPKRRSLGTGNQMLRNVLWRSMRRAATTKLLLLGALIAPAVTKIFGYQSDVQLDAKSIGVTVAFAVSSTMGLNAWAYSGGGTLFYGMSPGGCRRIIRQQLIVLAGVFYAAALAGMLVGRLVGAISTLSIDDFVVTGAAVLVLASLGNWWSTTWPAAADHDSLRTRPAGMRSVFGFVATAGLILTVAVLIGTASYAAGIISCLVVCLTLELICEANGEQKFEAVMSECGK